MQEFNITSNRTIYNNPQFRDADAWQVRITNPRGKTFSTKYYKGYGFKGEKPTLDEVLESLVLDANTYRDMDEAEFVSDLYPDDPELGKKIYKECGNIADRLENFLTDEEREHFTDM